MKFLKENYGESEELDTFHYQLHRRFGTYYIVRHKQGNTTAEKRFAYKDAAKEYYDGLVKEAKQNPFYYDGDDISLLEIVVEPLEEELESIIIYDEDDEEIKD